MSPTLPFIGAVYAVYAMLWLMLCSRCPKKGFLINAMAWTKDLAKAVLGLLIRQTSRLCLCARLWSFLRCARRSSCRGRLLLVAAGRGFVGWEIVREEEEHLELNWIALSFVWMSLIHRILLPLYTRYDLTRMCYGCEEKKKRQGHTLSCTKHELTLIPPSKCNQNKHVMRNARKRLRGTWFHSGDADGVNIAMAYGSYWLPLSARPSCS